MMNTPTAAPAIPLVAGDRFFIKEVALDPGAPASSQVELALEESSPFPLGQLFHGFVVSPDRRQALAYASYRRRFTAEEMTEWPESAAVLPGFLALVGTPPSRPRVVVQINGDAVNGVAWNGQSGLPAAVGSRVLTDGPEVHLTELVEDLRRRAGLPDNAEVQRLEGPVGVGSDDDGDAVFRIDGNETARIPAAALADADIRDKSFLHERRREEVRRRGWVWALTGAVALVMLALGLEIAAFAWGTWNGRQRQQVAAQADEVRRIETAQTLATRIEDLTARQERPLEWLSLVSAARPRSIQFLRVVSNNDHSLTIDAQTPDAGAVGAYEAALRQRPELEQVETRDLRSREGMTSFVLAVRFKPANAPTEGGQP